MRFSEFFHYYGLALQYITLLSEFIDLLKRLLKRKYFRLIRKSLDVYDKALPIVKKIINDLKRWERVYMKTHEVTAYLESKYRWLEKRVENLREDLEKAQKKEGKTKKLMTREMLYDEIFGRLGKTLKHLEGLEINVPEKSLGNEDFRKEGRIDDGKFPFGVN
ncbi:MAG: hypothetical protein ACXQTT_04850 [Candidatus Syntropharchaeia archaeon]